MLSAMSWHDDAKKLISKAASNPNLSREDREDLTEALADLKASGKMLREIMAQNENIIEDNAEQTETPTDGRTGSND